jgi:dynactin-4
LYHCSHLLDPHPPLPPVYPSSSSSFSPLDNLYFCEECDAIRCDQCVAVEVASYFCPSCLFDVPSANVRGDRNRSALSNRKLCGQAEFMCRCARSCFSCPQCSSYLAVHATDNDNTAESSSNPTITSSYFLACSGCKWSSKEIGWIFEKPSGLACKLSSNSTLLTLPSTARKDTYRA